jgi:glycosyltransferase involved in cell wall biosynthesis
MAENPYFSVVIPAYNRASVIQKTLASVAAQSDDDWECIIVDDGSEDGDALEAVVDSMNDPRFICLRGPNRGGGAARNTGIMAARGRYIAFLDSDDFFIPEKLETCRDWISRTGHVALYSQVRVDRGEGRVWVRPDRGIAPGEDVGEYLFAENQFIQTSSIVIAREAAVATLFDPDLRKGQDLDFCLRLQRDGVHFVMLPKPLAIWTDVAAEGRTSHLGGHEAPLAWLAKSDALLTQRARVGYRATVLAYYLSSAKPFTVAGDLARALLHRVPAKVVARNALRAYLPRGLYRRMVDGFIAARMPRPKAG